MEGDALGEGPGEVRLRAWTWAVTSWNWNMCRCQLANVYAWSGSTAMFAPKYVFRRTRKVFTGVIVGYSSSVEWPGK